MASDWEVVSGPKSDWEQAGQQKQPQSSPGKASGDWTDMIPGVAGTLGQIGGGILGAGAGVGAGAAIPGADLTGVPEVAGGIGGERIGQTAGGALGQGVGESIRQWIQNISGKTKGFDPGAIGSETAQGGLYGAIPGSQLIKGPANFATRALATGAKNFAGGAVIGGATQGVRNIQQGNPIGQNIGSQAAEVGTANTLLPGVGHFLSKGASEIGNHLLSRIPVSLKKQLDSIDARMTQLETEKLGNTVGHANANRATNELGIYHTHTPQQALRVIEKEMQDVGGQLNGALGHETVGTNLAAIKNEFLKARDQAFSGNGKNDEKLTDFLDRASNFIKAQIQKAAEESAAAQTPASEAAAKAAADASARAEKTAQGPATLGSDQTGNRTIKFGKQGPITSTVNGEKIKPMPGESPQAFVKRLQDATVKGNSNVTELSPSQLRLQSEINKANDFNATPATGGMNRDQAVDFANDQSPVSLLTVNKIKEQLGTLAYGKDGEIKDPIFAQAYHNLQKHIEDSSGNPDQISGLNTDYNQLRNMAQHASREIENPKMTATDFAAKKLKLENEVPVNPHLETLAALAPILGGTILGGTAFGPGGAIGGASSGFALYRFLSKALSGQGFQRGYINKASAIKNSGNQGAGKVVKSLYKGATSNPIQRAIQQGLIQSPGNQ